MFCQRFRFALLAGVCLAGAAASVRADHAPSATAAAAAPSATTCKVLVNEWVPETYKATRTSYRMEQHEEKYTAIRHECVPEKRTRTCTTYKMVSEEQEVIRNVCVSVPAVEERTVTQAHWTCKPVTKIVRKCVDNGHYECREVPCGPTLRDRLRKLCGKDCCEPCPRTKTVKVWVSCPTIVETPVTVMERVCEHRQVTCKVNVCRTELRQEKVKVNVCKCVPVTHNEEYTVMVQKPISFEAKRMVCKCVPVTEEVTCTRLVCRQVEKEVAATTCCSSPCCTPCCKTSCKTSRCCK